MAIESICGKLMNDLDGSCIAPSRSFWQQAVVIYKSDVDSSTVSLPVYDGEGAPSCNYTVEFALKCMTKGIRISGVEAGEDFKGFFDKSRLNGYPVYKHKVQIFVAGSTEATKCAIDALDKGKAFIALQLKDGTVEIYGWENGLSTGDYTWDIAAGGGGTPIIMESSDSNPENYLPLVYKPASNGTATADFDSSFAGAETCE